MSDRLIVKSRFRTYEVSFVERFSTPLRENGAAGVVLIDEKIKDLYVTEIRDLVPKEVIVSIEAKESCKTIDYCKAIIDKLIERNIRKTDVLVVVGGGIVQDIGAFVAAILFRGIEWHFYPTTLLAQADSCIGSKCSLNLGRYKNLLGTFYPPSRVFLDAVFLETLPLEHIKSGIGEMLHFYLVDGDEIADKLVDNYEEVIDNRRLLVEYIRRSLEIKRKLVEIDEFDKNERRLFNYGHTFGHAIESVSDYAVNHGQAVTLGMDIANYVSYRYGYLNYGSFEEMRRLLAKNLPEFVIKKEMLDDYFMALSKDKKNVRKDLGCILTRGPGAMLQIQLPIDAKLKGMILEYFEKYGGGGGPWIE